MKIIAVGRLTWPVVTCKHYSNANYSLGCKNFQFKVDKMNSKFEFIL